jgi:hypothetical protein
MRTPRTNWTCICPKGRRNAPVIVWYYGNQLMGGDKSEDEFVGRRFASAGFVTAVVNYRLSPAVSHPAHVEDAAASFAWVSVTSPNTAAMRIGCSRAAILLADILWHCSRPTRATLRRTSCRLATSEAWPVSAFYWVERRGVAPDRDMSVWGTDRAVWVDASPAHHLHANARRC